VILFGAHAGHGLVGAGPHQEIADRQILVVVSDERLTNRHDYWCGAEERLQVAYGILGSLSAPVNLLVRSIREVNAQLEKGRPFFTKIIESGVPLYKAPGCSFSSCRRRGSDEFAQEAAAYFKDWMGAAERRLKTFALEMAEARRDPAWRKDAAFTLHQAVERLYGCLLLTREGYSPAIHQIGALRSLAEQVEPCLAAAWPRETKEHRRAFELLRQAYIRGRYASDYRITEGELGWLAERTRVLRRLVRAVSEEFLSVSFPESEPTARPTAPFPPPAAARSG
jgi:HEPN domain-containing protein